MLRFLEEVWYRPSEIIACCFSTADQARYDRNLAEK
jgi:hypothetical protein